MTDGGKAWMTDHGAWFDEKIRGSRFGSYAFERTVSEADFMHGSEFTAEILRSVLDTDDLQELYFTLPAIMREKYCRRFIQRHPQQARKMYVDARDTLDPEEAKEDERV